MELDTILRNGTVVDGTGAPPRRADVGIAGGRVVAVGDPGDVGGGSGAEVVDVEGRMVAPGFVDLHTHYDAQVLWDPTASPSPLHGVTTVIGGNCGFSIAPLGTDHVDYVRRMMARVEGIPLDALATEPWSWSTFGEWLDRIDGTLAVNAGFLVGHSTVRRVVMGADAVAREATPGEVARMAALVDEALAAGALGFSSSLNPTHLDGAGDGVPSLAASAGEMVELAGVVGRHEGTHLEFIPGLGEIPEERMRLMADMSLAAGRPLNWNLLGSLSSTEIYRQQLEASDLASRLGARVVALTLPDLMRMRGGTVLASLPGWSDVIGGDRAARAAAAASPEVRAALRAGAEAHASAQLGVLADFSLMEVAEAGSEATAGLIGRSLADIAAGRGTDVVDVLIDVVLVEGLPLAAVLPSLVPSLGRSDEGWAARVDVWRDPRVVLGGSDAGAHLDLMCHANYPTVVLGEVVRDRGLLPVEEAVQMMSDVPARLHGLVDRGRVAPGHHADLVVFDPDTVGSLPAVAVGDLPGGGIRLVAEAVGVDLVLVNGRAVVRDGTYLDARPGTLLRSGRDTALAPLPSP